MKPKAGDVIRMEYGYKRNFMTPNQVGFGWIGDTMVYELSEGEGPFGMLYAITVVNYDPTNNTTERNPGLSRVFGDEKILKAYLEELNNG
jgi:hypothetical protein